ncbi:MAG: hypothetical protein HGA54_04405 [Actinobacteria bacterium]|nr:hypothetical protein [Actinomycetota bacterium]
MFDNSELASRNGTSATVSIGNWMAIDCINLLNLIPIVGSIAALVIFLVMAFGSSTAPSVKNRLLAYFVWALIQLLLCLVFLFAFGGLAFIMDYLGTSRISY